MYNLKSTEITDFLIDFLSILAGSAAAEGKAGARPQDQVQLAVHRQREVSLHEEVLPCRLPRHKALGLKYYVYSQKT